MLSITSQRLRETIVPYVRLCVTPSPARSNSAFLPEGVQIVGHVIKVNERKGCAHLDVGFRRRCPIIFFMISLVAPPTLNFCRPQTFPSSELGGAPAVGDKVTLLLERVETPLGAAPLRQTKKSPQHSANNRRPDHRCACAARAGDMQLTPNESHEGNRTEAIWREIRTAHAEGRRIKARRPPPLAIRASSSKLDSAASFLVHRDAS